MPIKLDGEMLSSRFGILAEAISIASSSLQQNLSLRYCHIRISEAVVQNCSVKKVFLKILQNSSGTGVSCEFCDILKNTFFRRPPPVTVSGICINKSAWIYLVSLYGGGKDFIFTCIFFRIIRPQTCNFIKRETLAQVLFCEFCEIFKKTFFTEHLRTTATDFFHWITI